MLRKYVAHANVLTFFTYAETSAVNAYLFKYFKYVKGKLIHVYILYPPRSAV